MPLLHYSDRWSATGHVWVACMIQLTWTVTYGIRLVVHPASNTGCYLMLQRMVKSFPSTPHRQHLHFKYLTRQLCSAVHGKDFLINLCPEAQNLITLIIILSSPAKRVINHNDIIRPFWKTCHAICFLIPFKIFISNKLKSYSYSWSDKLFLTLSIKRHWAFQLVRGWSFFFKSRQPLKTTPY